MDAPGARSSRLDGVLLLLVLALFLFASPFTAWWAGIAPAWYLPFLLWGLLIALVAVHQWVQPDDDA